MKCNMGKTDKTIRIIIGVAILISGVIFNSWWGLLGFIPIMVALSGRCGLYYLLKIDTSKKETAEK